MNSLSLGKRGEGLAAFYLEENGYDIKYQNYFKKTGEIDIIAEKNKQLVFIEVKTRKNTDYGHAYEAVDYRKQKKIVNTSLLFLAEMDYRDWQLRYDIIEIYIDEKVSINHIVNAFSGF